jgi:hypothetical protein
LAGAVWLTLVMAGCPLREKEIRITDDGIQWILNACTPAQGPFPPSTTGGFPPPPFGAGGSGAAGSGGAPFGGFAATGGGGGNGPGGGPPPGAGGSYCHLEGNYPATGSPREARLFLISPGDRRVQDASKCMSLHSCGDGGRPSPSTRDCIASDINQQLDGAMPNGLGFNGLQNPEEALVVLAFYQPTDTSEVGGGCHRTDLYACAGLAAPFGGGAYDISCASCEGGSTTAPGNDTGPCPRDQDKRSSCFLQTCDEILRDSGFD